MKVGDVVLDDLTGLFTVITGVLAYSEFAEFLTISSPYLGGARFPWEVTRLEEMSE